MKKNKTFLINAIIFIILFISFIFTLTIRWLYKTFGNLSLEEIVFHIKVPMAGANTDYYFDYAKKVLPLLIICTLSVYGLICFIFRKKKFKKPKGKRMKGSHSDTEKGLVVYKRFRVDPKVLGKLLSTILVFVISTTYVINRTDLIVYIKNYLADTDIFEYEYIDPRSVEVTFPENKRNLIYIYLESMETTYFSKENGGAFDESIIPELEQLAQDNTSFSCSDNQKGLYVLPGTAWTVGAMTAQTIGLPLKIPIEGNSYGKYKSFMPGAYSIGQILQNQGYNQMLMVGSDAKFAGRDELFKQHGNYKIFDVYTAVEEEKVEEENFVWWGYPDRNLFDFAKEKITMFANEEQPFNLTMLTVDTHPVNGYFCEDCEEKFDEQYLNVLACSSKKVKEFVDWVQTQDFYENTTIVICGDHLSMQPDLFEEIENRGYNRTVYNVIINAPIEANNTQNKYCSTFDMFPTTLASLGVTIKDERLGLGTNLFSENETLIERLGQDYVVDELCKNSKYYNKKYIYDND